MLTRLPGLILVALAVLLLVLGAGPGFLRGGAPPRPVMVNTATGAELETLPGIGPRLADRIVVDRQENGDYRHPADLLRVPGLGARVIYDLVPWLDFYPSGVGPERLLEEGPSVPQPAPEAGPAELGLPEPWGYGVVSAAPADPSSRPARIELNTAGLRELLSLPGIGPGLALRILESRESEGPYREVDDLSRVHGIGPHRITRLRPLLTCE